MQQNLSDMTKKRLALIESYDSSSQQLTDTELEWIYYGALIANKGPRTKVSGPLDISYISAPVQDVMACLSPGWVPVRCHHGNTAWKMIRCRKCDGCLHAWRAKVRALILDGCSGSVSYMWTLTVREYPRQMKGDKFDVTQKRYHDLLRSAGKLGVSFEYLRVVEMQKRGTPHFHIALKDVRRNGRFVSTTEQIRSILRNLAKKSGFGYVQGKTFDLQAARLGGAGVASYMSKYLEKSEDYNALRREDGRAIRRYCRSRGWCAQRPLPDWRYARDGNLERKAQVTQDVSCDCGDHMLLNRDHQVTKWIAANRRAGRWVAPLGVADYLLSKGKENGS